MLVIGGGFNCNVISLTTGASTGGLLLRTHNHTRANTRASTHTRTIPPLLHLPGATLHESTRSGRVRCVALSPTGDYVLAGGFDNMVTVQLVGGGAEMQSFDATAFFDHEQDDPLGRPPKPLPRSEVRGSLAGSVRSSSSAAHSSRPASARTGAQAIHRDRDRVRGHCEQLAIVVRPLLCSGFMMIADGHTRASTVVRQGCRLVSPFLRSCVAM